jgi:hypothetical protein
MRDYVIVASGLLKCILMDYFPPKFPYILCAHSRLDSSFCCSYIATGSIVSTAGEVTPVNNIILKSSRE